MAAYAALVSLTNIVDQIQNHPRISTSLDSNQIESLRENADFLLDFIESNHSHGGGSEEAEILETEIASAAHAAEDVIESHIVDQIHSGSISLLDLQTVIEDMDSVKDKVANFREKRGLFKDHKDGSTHSMSAPLITSSGKNKMVGFDEELIQLMDELTGRGRNLQIITIVGMGGIGKTTLTRNVYEKSLILRHFDVRAWATISQEYSARAILLELLYCQSKSSEQLDQKAEHRLGEQLRKSLFNRRYLIVLDDLWSIEAWDEIKFFFPDNNNGSRIIITTRLSNVAVHFGSSCLLMKLLDEDKSWKLFCEKAFSPEGCPLELVEIGKKIAEKCKGLPLLITVTGALLGKSSRTQEYWEIISKDINSVLDLGHDEQSVDILSLSYRHLPVHLKPCFLYMGIFLEDREIYVSQLVKLWVAEGFIKPNKNKAWKRLQRVT